MKNVEYQLSEKAQPYTSQQCTIEQKNNVPTMYTLVSSFLLCFRARFKYLSQAAQVRNALVDKTHFCQGKRRKALEAFLLTAVSSLVFALVGFDFL